MRKIHYAAAAMLLALFASCSCGDDPVVSGVPNPHPDPSALSMEACPDGAMTDDIVVQNTGTANLQAELVLVGAHPEMFTLDRYELNLGRGSSQKIEVTYHPTSENAGELGGEQHTASLEIRYRASGEAAMKSVSLIGDVANAAATPTPSMECAPGVPVCISGESGKLCCRSVSEPGSPSYITRLSLGGVPFGEKAELPVVIKNLGCEPLAVTAATLEFGAGNNTCEPSELTIRAPASVQGLGSEEMQIDFAPALNRGGSCEFTGFVQVKWGGENDDSKMALDGKAIAPTLNVTPPLKDFGELLPGATATQEFRVYNSGNEDMEIAEVRFEGDAKAEFRVVSYRRHDGAPVSGPPFSLAAGASLPLGGPHEVYVTMEYAPSAPPHRALATMVVQSTGGMRATVPMTGGRAPDLHSFPEQELSFSSPGMGACLGSTDLFDCSPANPFCTSPCTSDGDCDGKCLIADGDVDGICESEDACAVTCGGASRVARFCNRSTSPLAISRVLITGADSDVDQPLPAPKDPLTGIDIFSVQYDECSGASLGEGVCCDVGVAFQDTRVGGGSGASLWVLSDDPSHADGYRMLLTATTRPNIPPVNVVDSPAEVILGEWVRFDPTTSRDDRGVESFKWRLDTVSDSLSKLVPGPIEPDTIADRCKDGFGPSAGEPCMRLLPDGSLEIFPDRAATYQVELTTGDICLHESKSLHRVTSKRPEAEN